MDSWLDCNVHILHTENTKFSFRDRGVESCTERESQHFPCIGRIDDSIVPETGRRIVRRSFLFILFQDGIFQSFFFLSSPLQTKLRVKIYFYELWGMKIFYRFPLTLSLFLRDLCHNTGRLLTAHDRNSGVRPHIKESRAILKI